MRRLCFNTVFGRLALVAILLLSTLPTLGRLATLPEAMPHAMAAGHGNAMPAHSPAGDPLQPGHAHGHDCPYCLLLGGALPSAPVALAVAAPPPGSQGWTQAASARLREAGVGLGARGPPLPG